ncbi:MAG TPA: hypothetical protein VFM74_05915 [Candidatus Limnocylindria bacterium]|nr:hypothetical protein [Candidatus Limnocylindria bacterium]
MRVVASASAVESIAEDGGRLYVWLKRGRCCGNLTTLASASTPPRGREFRLVDGTDFELYLPLSLTRIPDELHVELRRFPRRVEAYWNGCAWVI